MGQLETFSIDDNLLPMLLSGMLNGYVANELESTLESMVPYAYSANAITLKK